MDGTRPFTNKFEAPGISKLMNLKTEDKEELLDLRISKPASETQQGSTFSVFAEKVTSLDEVNQIYTKLRLQFPSSTHISAGYILDGSFTLRKVGSQDDGEYGMGRNILKTLKDNQVSGIAIFVRREYGGKRMGGKRFRVVRSLIEHKIKKL